MTQFERNAHEGQSEATAMIKYGFFASLLLAPQPVATAPPDAEPAYGPELQGFDYPFPVKDFAFTSQGESLRMAYMDVAPAAPNGRAIGAVARQEFLRRHLGRDYPCPEPGRLPGHRAGSNRLLQIKQARALSAQLSATGAQYARPAGEPFADFEGELKLAQEGPLFAFAGIWRLWTGERKGEPGEHRLFSFLTTDSNDVVRPIHAKAMPVILATPEEWDAWLGGSMEEVIAPQRPFANIAMRIVARSENKDQVTALETPTGKFPRPRRASDCRRQLH